MQSMLEEFIERPEKPIQVCIPDKPTKMRPSAVSVMVRCPVQAVLSNEGYGKPSEVMILGSIGHRALYWHKKDGAKGLAEESLDAHYADCISKDNLDDGYEFFAALDRNDQLKIKGDVKLRLRGYDKWPGKDKPLLLVESEFAADVDGVPVIGHVDAIDHDLTLIDYKFTKSKGEGPFDEQYLVQMGGYVFLARKAGYDVKKVILLKLVPWDVAVKNVEFADLPDRFVANCRSMVQFYYDLYHHPFETLEKMKLVSRNESGIVITPCQNTWCFQYAECTMLRKSLTEAKVQQ